MNGNLTEEPTVPNQPLTPFAIPSRYSVPDVTGATSAHSARIKDSTAQAR